MIIEDEPLVALDLHAALSRKGASVISATSAAEAAKLIGYADISAAIVDINLGTQDAAEACRLLAKRGIPFVFHTGQRHAALLAKWPNAPVFPKPARPSDLVEAIAALLSDLPMASKQS